MNISARLLAVPGLEVGDERLELPASKSSALLFYLACKGTWLSRDDVLYLLWADSPEEPARSSLRQLLSALRRLPYTQALEVERSRLRWPIPTDVQAFRRAVTEGRQADAAKLYAGELLHGFKPRNLPEFDTWLAFERQELHTVWREAVLSHAGELEAARLHHEAADFLARLCKADPLDEEALRPYLRNLHLSDQRSKALKTYEIFRHTLQHELAQEPEHATRRIAESLSQEEHPATKHEAVKVMTSPGPTPALPVVPTSLIGRRQEVATIAAQLARETLHLLTLVGPPGIGKTRLALEVARHVTRAFPGGIYFVPLALVREVGFTLLAIAQALGVKASPDQPLEQAVAAAVADKQVLLVLDNFEHVLATAPFVGQLLATCRNLKVLVTSRTPLHIYGEYEQVVPPLSLPDPASVPSPETLVESKAVRLFVDRAQAAKADFGITQENARAVAEICVRLDGLPLALELAAARIKLFTPEALLKRLASRFELLTGGASNLPVRHQTLHNALTWSYDLLDAKEQLLFRRLSVFSNGFSTEAVQEICNVTHDLPDVFAGLVSILDQNLLRQVGEVEGEPRFGMLETVHEFAKERLEQRGEAEAVRRAHASYFLALAETAEPHLTGAYQAKYLAQLEREHDNLLSALRWLEQHCAEDALRLTGALWRFWYMRGYLSEGRHWLRRSLTLTERREVHAARAKALAGAGGLAFLQGDYPEARALHEQSLAIARELGDIQGMALALNNLGNVFYYQGDYTSARSCYEESLAFRQNAGDSWGIAGSLTNLGNVAREQGDYARARLLYEESLATWRTLGDTHSITLSLHNLGLVLHDLGDHTRARALLEETLVLSRELGDKQGIAIALRNLGDVVLEQDDYAWASVVYEEALEIEQALGDTWNVADVLHGLGYVAFHQGDRTRASALFRESLLLRRTLNNKRGVIYSLEAFAALGTVEGEPKRAARLWGAAEALRDTLVLPLPPNYRPRYERLVATTRAALGEMSFTEAWAEGRTMSLKQAAAYALGEADAVGKSLP